MIGVSVLSDFVYSNWFKYVLELVCMGVKIWVEGCLVIIEGGVLNVVKVKVLDFCVGVVLVIVGLMVKEGVIEVIGVEFIDCGYDYFVINLCFFGVDVWCEME